MFLAETLLNALRKCERKSIPTIVFCNKSTTVMYLQRMLKENDITNFSALYKLPHTKGVSSNYGVRVLNKWIEEEIEYGKFDSA